MGIAPPSSTFEYQFKEVKKESHPILGEITQITHLSTSRQFTLKRLVCGQNFNQQKMQQIASLQSVSPSENMVGVSRVFAEGLEHTLCMENRVSGVVFDDVQLSLESVVQSGRPFNDRELLNLTSCVLNGLMKSQQLKHLIYPLCEKSIIVCSGQALTSPGSLEEAIFKVIPFELAEPHDLKNQQLKIYACSEDGLYSFYPKSYIYSLGHILADIIIGPLKAGEISFQEFSENEDKLQLLKSSSVSPMIVKLIGQMVEEDESRRIGLVTLYDECNRVKAILKGQTTPLKQLSIVAPYEHNYPSKKFSKKAKRKISSIARDQNPGPAPKKSLFQMIDFDNGAKYVGNMNEDRQFEGEGTLYYPDSSVCYQGHWRNNLFSGHGCLHAPRPSEKVNSVNYVNFSKNAKDCWDRYEGEFLGDKKNGRGVLYFGSDEKFTGQFSNDLIHGEGTFCHANGKKVKGVWKNNRLFSVLK